MGMGIGILVLQCAAEFEYRWNVGLQNVRWTIARDTAALLVEMSSTSHDQAIQSLVVHYVRLISRIIIV